MAIIVTSRFCLGMLTQGVVLAQKRVADRPQWVKLRRPTADGLCGVGDGFIDQQNRNIVPNWIHAPAITALQAFPIFFEHQRFFAYGADQDVQQILWNHASILRLREAGGAAGGPDGAGKFTG